MRKLNEEVQAIGARFGVVVIPHRDDLADGNLKRQSLVTAFCVDNQILHLDLAPLLTVEDYFETDIHFNIDGHRIVATAIDAFVAESFTRYPK